jgi:diphthine methyl ester acylhydrolase
MASASASTDSQHTAVTHHALFHTPKCADSVEAFVNAKDGSCFAAVSGYELNTETGVREGSLQGFLLAAESSDPVLVCEQREVAGVLDGKWARAGEPRFATVHSDSHLRLWNANMGPLDEGEDLRSWEARGELLLGDDILLSLDWSLGSEVAVSRRDGRLSLVDGVDLVEHDSWIAHEYSKGCAAEAWIVACNFHVLGGPVLWSGGDDCSLKGWDLREPATGQGSKRRRKPTFVVEGDAGFCSCQWHPSNPHLVASGGYDSLLRVWDERSMGAPLSSFDVGGGVWRIKWGGDNELLIAGMRGGAWVLRMGDALEPVTHMTDHESESLTYGADWLFASSSRLAGTCSFYNREFRVWSF